MVADVIDLLARLNTAPLPVERDFARLVIETLEALEYHKADLRVLPLGNADSTVTQTFKLSPAPEDLRDYFAGQALAGLATGLNIDAIKALAHERAVSPTEAAARIAYDFADAMLKVRG